MPLHRAAGGFAGAVRGTGVVFAAIASEALRGGRNRIGASPRFRIAIDVRPFYEQLTGVGWYAYHLLDEWSRRDDVELIGIGEAFIADAGPELRASLPSGVRMLRFDLRGRTSAGGAIALARAAYPVLIRAASADAHFAPNYFFPRAQSAVASPRIVTVHDLTFRRHPELLQKETLENLESEMERELARADAVICVSESTRRDLIELFDVSPSRAFAIHSGLGNPPRSELAQMTLPERFALFVSTIEPRKNVDAIIRACETLWDRGEWDGELVLAGRIGWKAERTLEAIQSSRWSSRIHRFDYLSPEQLATLYSRADMFLFPSWYEGFGFPLLEAMAAGVPSITSNNSSLPEVGGDAALYVDPSQPDELAAAMLRITTDAGLRARLAAEGPRQAARFDWSRCADETLALLRRTAGKLVS